MKVIFTLLALGVGISLINVGQKVYRQIKENEVKSVPQETSEEIKGAFLITPKQRKLHASEVMFLSFEIITKDKGDHFCSLFDAKLYLDLFKDEELVPLRGEFEGKLMAFENDQKKLEYTGIALKKIRGKNIDLIINCEQP